MRFGRRSAAFWILPVAGILLCAALWLAFRAARVRASTARSKPSLRPADPRLAGAYRFERGGWIYVHLQGSPEQIGYQHGYLLAPEIADAFAAVKLSSTHQTHRNWEFFRRAAREMLWPKIDPEYQQELRGIVEGLRARGIHLEESSGRASPLPKSPLLGVRWSRPHGTRHRTRAQSRDLYDLVALNAFSELSDYYVPWYNRHHHVAGAPRLTSPGNCSAFVATGSWTRDHQIVIAHNNWTDYLEGERWRVIFDLVPAHGYRIVMDGFPGVITSDDDFGINSAGVMVTETTISQFHGWDSEGKPEFVRSRKAMQYAASIDDYVRIMLDGNNGGYANDWLLGDRKTGEIAQFELGLKHYRLWRTRDGYFVGSNFARDPKVIADETTFDPHNPASSPNARRTRWEELMWKYKGKIDVALAEKFEADHFDAYAEKEQPDERTLCGHADASSRGVKLWNWTPYYPGGAVQGKVTDSAMAAKMTLVAHLGHPCGENFLAKPFLAAHPEYSWEAPLLRDMPAGPWTVFRAGERAR